MSDSSRTKSFFKNVGATSVYQLLLIFSGLIIPRIILNFYGSEANGLISSVNQFISGFKIVEAGLAGAGILALYKPLAEKNEKKINGILAAIHKFYIQTGAFFLGLVIILAVAYPLFKPTSIMDDALVRVLVFVLGGRAFLEFFAVSKYRIFLIASQKVWVISLASASSELLSILLISVLAGLRVGLVFIYTVALIPLFVRFLIIYIYIKRTSTFINLQEKPQTSELKKRWDVLYLQILGIIHSSAPVVIVTFFLSLELVSVYSVHSIVFAGISSILGIFSGPISPGFGNIIARKEKLVLQKTAREFEVIHYALISFLYSVSAVMITSFVDLYTAGVDDVEYHQPLFAFLIALNGFMYSLKTPQGMLVTAAGLYRETRIQTTIQGCIAVIGGLILTPLFGLIGLAIAMILSNIYRDIDLLFFIPKHLTHLPVRDSALRMLQAIGTSALIFIPCHLLALNPATPLEWVRDAVLVSAFAALVTLGTNLLFQRELVFSIFRRVKLALGVAT